MLEAFFQRIFNCTYSSVTVPAVTEPVLVQNKKHPFSWKQLKLKDQVVQRNRIRFRRAIIETVGGSSLSKFATEAVVLHSTFEAFFFFQEYLIVPKAPVTVPAVTRTCSSSNK
jgi:hypothetical protein